MRRSAWIAAALVAAALSLGFRAAADETISWSVRPLLVRWDELVIATGTIGSGQAGQLVTIQQRACDQQTWLDVGEATTTDNGNWSVDFLTRISGLLRPPPAARRPTRCSSISGRTSSSHNAVQRDSGRAFKRSDSTGTGGCGSIGSTARAVRG